ncbi:MAG: NAD(P)H-binding protein [Eubacteriales bacterium]
MKNVLILGATGTFGKELTKALLKEDKYSLMLFSRHAKQSSDSGNAKVVCGDATNKLDLQRVLEKQDVVYCAISGNDLPVIAQRLVDLMPQAGVKRLIFMGAVGIYNEIPIDMDGEDNVDNNPDQIPNRNAVQIIESSSLDYTVLRPGYLIEGNADDYVLTFKGQSAKGYESTIASVVDLAVRLIANDTLYLHESVSITRNMEK